MHNGKIDKGEGRLTERVAAWFGETIDMLKKHDFRIVVLRIVAKVIGIFAILFLLASFCITHGASKTKQDVARTVVGLLYDFGTDEQLEAQQLLLKRYLTEDVFNQLTVDNEERRLNTYLKFYGEASTVKFLKVTDDYIVYWIDSAAIDESRRFIFRYRLNSLGMICEVQEAEMINFIDYGNKELAE